MPDTAADSKQAQIPRRHQLSVHVAFHRKKMPIAVVLEKIAMIAEPMTLAGRYEHW
jgi:hypothetical protein